MKHAYFLKKLENLGQALYELDPPLDGNLLVVVSKVHSRLIHETYVFPANSYGDITDWAELQCSMRGEYSHEEVLAFAGYTVIAPLHEVLAIEE